MSDAPNRLRAVTELAKRAGAKTVRISVDLAEAIVQEADPVEVWTIGRDGSDMRLFKGNRYLEGDWDRVGTLEVHHDGKMEVHTDD